MTAQVQQRAGAQRAIAPRAPRKRPDYVGIGLWIALAIGSVAWFMPMLLMFFTSLKSKPDITNGMPWSLPTSWVWSNYADAVETGHLWTTGTNSLIVSLVKVPLGLFVASLAAFAIARIRFKGYRVVLAVFAIGAMVPIQIGLGPLFNTMLNLGLLDSYLGLLLPYLAFGVPYQMFMLYGFFRAIPDDIDESARLDGASTWRMYWQISMPLAGPALAALFILDFVATWNEYAMATTLMQSQEMWTIPLAVQGFSTQHATDYGQLNAFIIMSAIPVLIVYLLFQRYFVSGAFAGAIKG